MHRWGLAARALREKAAYFAALDHVYLSINEDECQATLSENKWEIIFTGVIATLTFVRRLERICIRAFVDAIATLLSPLLCLVCCPPNLAPDADRATIDHALPPDYGSETRLRSSTRPSVGGAPFGRRRRSAKAFK